MRRTLLVILLGAAGAGTTAVAQTSDNSTGAVLALASICSPPGVVGPTFDAIAARAPQWGWTELKRRDALKLQAIPDNRAVVRAWRGGPQVAATYLLVQTTETPRPRRLTCEVLFEAADSVAVQAALEHVGVGEPLGAPTLQGPLPAGGRFVEWAAPEASGWRLVNYSVPLPARKGPTLSRIRFNGVEN